LYLKALLRHVHNPKTLAIEFGHNMPELLEEARTLGLVVDDEDGTLLTIIADTALEERYIKTGSKTLPTLEALERTSKHIRDRVGELLRQRGVPIRL
jgi:hypothetical protein